MQNPSYQFQPSAQLTSKLAAIDAAQADIQRLRAQQPDRWQPIQQKLRAEWTYDSNAIEGSTLTLRRRQRAWGADIDEPDPADTRLCPVIVRNTKRRIYLQALAAADRGDIEPFLDFIADSMLDTQQVILAELY